MLSDEGYVSSLDQSAKTNEPRPRPRSLILYGGSQTGKSLFARSLEKYSYIANAFNPDDYSNEVKDAVCDDVERCRKTFSHKKYLVGQEQFATSDKHKRKSFIVRGRPCIKTANQIPLDERGLHVKADWPRRNAVTVEAQELLSQVTSL